MPRFVHTQIQIGFIHKFTNNAAMNILKLMFREFYILDETAEVFHKFNSCRNSFGDK